MQEQLIDNGVESPTELPGVDDMLLCHMTKGECEGLDNLQGGPSIDDDTGYREYSKLAVIIEDPEVQDIFKLIKDDMGDDGQVSSDIHEAYKVAKDDSLPFREAPAEKAPPVTAQSELADMGEDGDTEMAWLPRNLVEFLIELNDGEYSENSETGLLEFGFFKNAGKIFKRIVNNPFKAVSHGVKKLFGPEGVRLAGTIGGALLGGPLGAGIGTGLGNMVTGAGIGKSLTRGLTAGAGAYGLQAAGQMAGLGAATPYAGGFFGGQNALAGGLGSLLGQSSGTAAGSGVGAGLSESALAGKAIADQSLGLSASGAAGGSSMMGSLGSFASSPAAMMLAATGLNMLSEKQRLKEQNKFAQEVEQRNDRMRDQLGMNLAPIDVNQRGGNFVKNPNYVYGGPEPYYIPEEELQANNYKKGGLVKANHKELQSFTKSTGIYGPGNGQEDKIKTKIPSGSYIIDASSTADLGDGSSSSGIKVLEEAVRHIHKKHPTHVRKTVEKFIKKDSKVTPVYLANEEFKFDPVTVALAGGGNVDKGAKVFEKMVKEIRSHKNSNGLGLPPKSRHALEYMKIA